MKVVLKVCNTSSLPPYIRMRALPGFYEGAFSLNFFDACVFQAFASITERQKSLNGKSYLGEANEYSSCCEEAANDGS